MKTKSSYVGDIITVAKYNQYGMISSHVDMVLNIDSFIDYRNNKDKKLALAYDLWLHKGFLLYPRTGYKIEQVVSRGLSIKQALKSGKELAKKESIPLLFQKCFNEEYDRMIVWHPEYWIPNEE
jgi:hypothetical protein